MTREPDDGADYVPPWHPEGGGRVDPVLRPVPVGILLATALLLCGLALLQARVDGWLGAGVVGFGVAFMLHEVWSWRLPGDA